MGSRITTGTNTDLLQDMFHAAVFVKTLRKKLGLLAWADSEEAPDYSGKTIRWQYFANPSAKTTPLSEGGDPVSPDDVTTTTVDGLLREFGGYVEPAKLFMKTAHSGTQVALVERAAYQAALTYDTLGQTELATTTTSITPGSGLTMDDVITASRTLEDNNAMRHPKTPGGQFFVLSMAPEAAFGVFGEGAPKWYQLKDDDVGASGDSPFGSQDVGTGSVKQSAVANVIFDINTNTQTATSDDVNFMISGNSFGCLKMDSDIMKPGVIVTQPGARVDVALRNRGSVGWIGWFDVELFDSNRIIKVLSDQA